MVDFFVYRVKNGLKKWNEVPGLWRQRVIDKLTEERYILNEDGTVSLEVLANE